MPEGGGAHDDGRLHPLLENPVFRREWSLARPARFTRNAGLLGCVTVTMAIVIGRAGSLRETLVSLDELAWMTGAPLYLAFGLLQWSLLGDFRESGVVQQLHLTMLRPWQVIGGWYCALLFRWLAGVAIFLGLLPLFPDFSLPISRTSHILFVVAAMSVLDASARLNLLLALGGSRNFRALVENAIVAFAATLALYGVAGAAATVRDDFVYTPIALLIAGVGVYVLNVATWRPFILLAGKRYVRSIMLELEGDAETVDRPSPPKFRG